MLRGMSQLIAARTEVRFFYISQIVIIVV